MSEAGRRRAKEIVSMLRLGNGQLSLQESISPPELFEMSEKLAKIDRFLDDECFLAP